ncbi:MAG TPA: DNRLRE domain-containing protein [Tepidisphaeraceae bacterium]|jgi:hypothetical protein
MKMRIVSAAAAAASAVLLGSNVRPAWANTITLAPSKDNTIFSESPTFSNGMGSYFFVGATESGAIRRGLIAFDVAASVPAGSIINAATLTLNTDKSHFTEITLELHKSLADWGESTSNSDSPFQGGGTGAPAEPNDATWNSNFDQFSNWTTPGGDFSSTTSGILTFSDFGAISVPTSTGIVADVQNWLNTPSSNFGWFLIGGESGLGTAYRFDSKDNATASVRPQLTIDFSAAATPTVWNVDADGNFGDNGNWTNGAPNSPGAVATLGSVINAPRTITMAAPATLGTLNFDNSNRYTIAGSNTLTLAGSPQAHVNVISGSHSISAPVVLGADTEFSVGPAASVLDLSGPLVGNAFAISKSGAGTLRVENLRAGGIVVNAGTVQIRAKATANDPAGTSVIASASITAGQIDLTNNSMIMTAATGTGAAGLRQLIHDGRITTSSATPTTRLGYGDNAVLHKTSFAGQPVDSTALLLKYTYAGDADLDGDADGVDIGTWATNFTGELGGTGSQVWTQGDWDYDGDVDGVDAGLWAQAFTGELGGSGLGSIVVNAPISEGAAAILRGLGVTVVPEPASTVVVALIWGALRSRRRT